MVENALEKVQNLQISTFNYTPSIKTFKFKPGVLNNWILYLMKNEYFIKEINNSFAETDDISNIIIGMLECIIKTCKKINSNKNNFSSKFLKTNELFTFGLEYLLKTIKNDKYLHDIFLKFDSFIYEHIPKFIKIIVTKHSNNIITPQSIFNYFYKSLIFNKNLDIDYNIILSLLVGDEKITQYDILYKPMCNEYFIPFFYYIIKNKNSLC